MAEAATKLSVKTGEAAPTSIPSVWHPFDSLRRQVDRLFEDFDYGPMHLPFARSLFDLEPVAKRATIWNGVPAVDVTERDKQYEITAELPGLDEKNIEIKVAGGTLTISGEKTEEKEDKKKNYYMSERRYGSFRRSFRVPDGVDTDKIEASFKKGILTLTLPKTAEAQKQEKKIAINAG